MISEISSNEIIAGNSQDQSHPGACDNFIPLILAMISSAMYSRVVRGLLDGIILAEGM